MMETIIKTLSAFLGICLFTGVLIFPARAEAEYPVYPGVEYPGAVAEDNFLLLYNTLGYEAAGTKQAFVRSIQYVLPENVGDGMHWALMDKNDAVVAQGNFEYTGLSFGLQLWKADFSDIKTEGNYRLVATLTAEAGETLYQESSKLFLIENHLYSSNVLIPLTLYNAEARISTADVGGGYNDCNTEMGESHSHGIFLSGLVHSYVYLSSTLEAGELQRLQTAANIAFDYIDQLCNEIDGSIEHSHPNRYNADINLGYENTYMALYGYAAYLYYFRDIEPSRANDEAYKKAVAATEYLEKNFPPSSSASHGYPNNEFLVPVYYYLYQYSGEQKWQDKGAAIIKKSLALTNIRTLNRHGTNAIPLFEGAYLFAKAFPDHPDYDLWIRQLTKIKDKYFVDLNTKNAFSTLPVSNDMATSITEWDYMWRMPATWQISTRRATDAMDACFLAELTGDAALEATATNELGYIMGLNAGFESKYVEGADPDRPMAAGALMQNIPGQYVRCWKLWELDMLNDQWMSVINGYTMEKGDYSYRNATPNNWRDSETYIKYDGAFAYAFCVYERYMDSLGK